MKKGAGYKYSCFVFFHQPAQRTFYAKITGATMLQGVVGQKTIKQRFSRSLLMPVYRGIKSSCRGKGNLFESLSVTGHMHSRDRA